MAELAQQTTAKLVLLGEMGSGKSSLVLRYVKGQFFDYQVRLRVLLARPARPARPTGAMPASHAPTCWPPATQASTVGAAFLTKTIPELSVKFEIW